MENQNDVLMSLLALVDELQTRIDELDNGVGPLLARLIKRMDQIEDDVVALKSKAIRAGGTAYSFTKSTPPALQPTEEKPIGVPIPDHIRTLMESKSK